MIFQARLEGVSGLWPSFEGVCALWARRKGFASLLSEA
jgi:hypothetical protein